MAELTNEQKLKEARDALHRIATSGAVIEVRHEGQTMKYSEVNRKDLEAYIAMLEGLVMVPGQFPRRGHWGVQF